MPRLLGQSKAVVRLSAAKSAVIGVRLAQVRFRCWPDTPLRLPIERHVSQMLDLWQAPLLGPVPAARDPQVVARVTRLITALKQTRREKKALESVWTSLRQLKLGP